MKRIGIRTKFILLIVFLLLTIFAGIIFEIVQINAKNLRSGLEKESKSFAALAVSPIGETFLTYKDSGTIQITSQVQQFLDLDSNISNVTIADTSGNVQYNQSNDGPKHINPTLAGTFNTIYQYDSSHNISTIYTPFIESSGAHRYVIIYNVSSAALQSSLRQIVISTLGLGLLGLMLSILITYYLISRLFISPIQQMSHQALIISSGDLDQQIQQVRSDEIGDLASALNKMATNLKSDIQKLREVDSIKSEFMMISSHNLRTPLSVIQEYLMMLRGMKLSGEASRLVEIVDANTQRLKVFAENMLVIAQMEAGKAEEEPQKESDMNKFMAAIIEQLTTLASAKKIITRINVPENLPSTLIQSRRFHDALWNVLDNALKFTSAGGVIELSTVTTAKTIEINVKDSGIGISKEELPKLFTKFHRGTGTLTYDYEGTGIGLYLTKLIIQEQGGNITIASELGKGTHVKVILPLINQPPTKPTA